MRVARMQNNNFNNFNYSRYRYYDDNNFSDHFRMCQRLCGMFESAYLTRNQQVSFGKLHLDSGEKSKLNDVRTFFGEAEGNIEENECRNIRACKGYIG